jgi:hypothetical protein
MLLVRGTYFPVSTESYHASYGTGSSLDATAGGSPVADRDVRKLTERGL